MIFLALKSHSYWLIMTLHTVQHNIEHTTLYNTMYVQSVLFLFSLSGLPRKDRTSRTWRGGWTTGRFTAQSTSLLILSLLLENYEPLKSKYVPVTTAESWKTRPLCAECNQYASNGFETNFQCIQWAILSFERNEAWFENKLFHLIKISIYNGKKQKVGFKKVWFVDYF